MVISLFLYQKVRIHFNLLGYTLWKSDAHNNCAAVAIFLVLYLYFSSDHTDKTQKKEKLYKLLTIYHAPHQTNKGRTQKLYKLLTA